MRLGGVRRTVDWTGTAPNITPWVSAMRDLHLSLVRIPSRQLH